MICGSSVVARREPLKRRAGSLSTCPSCGRATECGRASSAATHGAFRRRWPEPSVRAAGNGAARVLTTTRLEGKRHSSTPRSHKRWRTVPHETALPTLPTSAQPVLTPVPAAVHPLGRNKRPQGCLTAAQPTAKACYEIMLSVVVGHWRGGVALNDETLAQKFADLWPHLNERQRRLVVVRRPRRLAVAG